jgi:Glycosyltransferase family 87
MREDAGQAEPTIRLATASVPGSAAPSAEPAIELPTLGLTNSRARWTRPAAPITFGPRAGRIGLAALVLGTLLAVASAAGGPSVLVPRSAETFPNWEAGPLHLVSMRLITNPNTVGLAFSVLLAAMIAAYIVVVAAVRTFSMRTIAIVVVVLHVILLLSPPLQLTDLFNYLGYARLGALHHLNPYTHVIKQEMFDPVYRFTSWHSLRSPYGQLFSAFTYPLAFMSLPLAYWTLKIVTVVLSLAFVGLVWHCARRLGRDPRFVVAFVAFNPIFLIYELAGFHNDFFMLAPSMGAIALLLARRDRMAGAALMVAIAVKFTAVLLLPFLLLAVRDRPRQLRVLLGAALAAIPLAALSFALFGVSLPNLQQQSSLLTDFSIPNVVGLLLHLGGGTPLLLKIFIVAVVVVVAYEFFGKRDWLNGAGWSTLALIASLAWLVPWYIVWLLPLAALGTSVRLRQICMVLTVFLIFAFLPVTSNYIKNHGNVDPLNTRAGHASQNLQSKLAR